MTHQSPLIRTLAERGFIHQCTDLGGLDQVAVERPVRAYVGFDLTADSLHVGSLIQIMMVRWMRHHGHKVMILLGEATTEIGDPTGKTEARPILTFDTIRINRDGIQQVLERTIGLPHEDMERGRAQDRTFITNRDWLRPSTELFSYLRDYGSHFSLSRMLAMESVKSRLDNNQSMSFLEFNYMLFQAIDFYQLHAGRANWAADGCDLQIGGSDQWGNITNGIELIRRKNAHDAALGKTVPNLHSPAFGLTTPLMTNAAGQKMGKTATGAVWLDPHKTSPFDFWQFWRNVEDAKVEDFLKLFTELGLDVIDHLMGVNGPGINASKELLATEVTTIVHGREEAERAKAAASGDASGLPVVTLQREPMTVGELFLNAGMVASKGEADRLGTQRGLRIDDEIVVDARKAFAPRDCKLSLGKRKALMVRFDG